jgi:hypothetical protein
VSGQVRNLDVKTNPTTLESGFNTTVIVNIINDFEPIYDVDISMNFPQSQVALTSPVVIGISNWRFEKIKEGEDITIEPLIFVPKDAAGSGYVANVMISYKRLGYISPYSESHYVGFYAKGEVDMVAYEFTVEEEQVVAGSSLSITASLLNKGTVTARFTNITLLPHPILILKPESYSYLGDVDPNSPSPFTLEAIVKNDTKEGMYKMNILTEYEDEERRSHAFENEVDIYVVIQTVETGPESLQDKVIEIIKNNLLYIIIGLAIIIIIVIIIRRLTSKSEFEIEEFKS